MSSIAYIGTTKRTWLDIDNSRVGRRYTPDKLHRLYQLHNLCHELNKRGIPVQQPVGAPMLVDNNLVAYYEYEKDDGPCDYSDEWYCPKVTSQRRRNAAAAFAKFQNAAIYLTGPDQPLDYPLCNSLKWINDPDPICTLLGPWSASETTLQRELGANDLSQLVNHLLPKAKPSLERSPWGLCHADFHDGNTIFQGDRLVLIVDFGFWIQHPLIFDLAIAVEFWGQGGEHDEFCLNSELVAEFLNAYAESRGPLAVSSDLLAVAAVSRLWAETHPVRRLKYPDEFDKACSHMQKRVLKRLRWYAEHQDVPWTPHFPEC